MSKLRGIRRVDPTKRFALKFSPMSLAKRRDEYRQVYDSLEGALSSPRAEQSDTHVVKQILGRHEHEPALGNLVLTLYGYEWPCVSRALRDWRAACYVPRVYNMASRAWARKEEIL